MRVPGHKTKLTVERDPEGNFWTVTCECGFQESAGSREVARDERRFHLDRIRRRREESR